MNVSKISMANPTAFRARTTITAPETLLSKEDKAYFVNKGSKIGKDSDVINITISDLYSSEYAPSTLVYNCSSKINIAGGYSKSSNIVIPYVKGNEVIETNSPKNYLENRVFSRL